MRIFLMHVDLLIKVYFRPYLGFDVRSVPKLTYANITTTYGNHFFIGVNLAR